MSARRELPDRQSVRLRWFDYSSAGFYFVTICTYDLQHAFGEIEHTEMHLSDAGRITQVQWLKLAERFSGVLLDEYVIMPNHMHGIIILHHKTNIANMPERLRTHMQTLAEGCNPQLKEYQPPAIGNVVRSYKAASTRLIRVSGVSDFGWHESYHERIIPDEEALNKVRCYIADNPKNWDKGELPIG